MGGGGGGGIPPPVQSTLQKPGINRVKGWYIKLLNVKYFKSGRTKEKDKMHVELKRCH